MSKMFAFSTDVAGVNKQITTVLSRAKSNDRNIKRVMVSCILCALEHGNTTPATQLIESMKAIRTIRVNGMARWLEVNGPYVWDKEKKTYKLDRAKCEAMKKDFKAKGLAKFATELMKVELAPNQEYKGFDLIGKLKALNAQAIKISKDENKAQSELTKLEGMDQLEAMLIALTQNDTEDMGEAVQLQGVA